MPQQRSSSPWEEFVLAAYRQAGSLLRDALGDNWFEAGVEPHTGEDSGSLLRGLFEGNPSNGSVKPEESIEFLQRIVVGNWDAFARGFDGNLDAAASSLDWLVLIAAEVAVKQGALPENVVEDFTTYGRALLEGLGSPAAGDIEHMAAGFPARPGGPRTSARWTRRSPTRSPRATQQRPRTRVPQSAHRKTEPPIVVHGF